MNRLIPAEVSDVERMTGNENFMTILLILLLPLGMTGCKAEAVITKEYTKGFGSLSDTAIYELAVPVEKISCIWMKQNVLHSWQPDMNIIFYSLSNEKYRIQCHTASVKAGFLICRLTVQAIKSDKKSGLTFIDGFEKIADGVSLNILVEDTIYGLYGDLYLHISKENEYVLYGWIVGVMDEPLPYQNNGGIEL
ncbi:MAG: hypothetical protein ACLT16_16905 [[Clostridium] innocuum]